MIFKIKKIDNGFIITYYDINKNLKIIFCEDSKGVIEIIEETLDYC